MSQRTVLIVDDCLEDRYTYRRYLLQDSTWSYQILEAETGQDALELYQTYHPDCILLDYLLPDSSGLEVLVQLKTQSQAEVLPVIMLTGQGNEAIAVQVMKAGAQDYLVKGELTPADLRFAIDAVIEKMQLRAQLKAAEAERLQRIQRERLIDQIAQQVHRSLDVNEVLQTTVDKVRIFLQTDRTLVFRLNEQDGTVVTESVNPEWIALLSTDIYDPCFSGSYIHRYQHGRVMAVTDIHTAGLEPCHFNLLSQLQVRANLVVPILQDQKLWGLLIAHHCSAPREWQPLEIDLLKQLATQVGIALQQAELYQQVQRQLADRTIAQAALQYQTDRERLVSQIAQRIRQTLDLAEVLNKTVTEVRHFLKCDRVFMYRFNPDFTGVIEVESVGENWQSILAAAVEDTYFTTTQGEDYCRGRIQATADIYNAGLTDCHIALLAQFQVRANLAVPILQGKKLWGLLVANQCSEMRDWQPLEIDLLQQLATQVGIAIQQSEFHQQVRTELSERQRAEIALQGALQKLNFHVENSPLAVIEWDGDLRITRWSKEAEKIFGWTAAEVLGRNLEQWQFVFEADVPAVQAVVQQILSGTISQVKCCNRNYAKDGSVLHCEWYNSTLTDAEGRLTSMLSLVLNISDRIQLEQERDASLQQEQVAREQAEQANRVKDEFLAVLSHELRTPLNPILGWSKMLQSGRLDPVRTKEALATIERNAKLQSQLIEDLLDVSRILRGKLALQVSSVNLATIIKAAIGTVGLAAEAKHIQIQTIFPELPIFVSGDAARLQQVVWNLLSNAVKFTPQSGQIKVQFVQDEASTSIQVIDTGKGISAEFLPYVFDYFRQQDSATTRKFGGLGLGLAIVRQIVELHGGTVTAASPGEDQGAIFTVSLPILKPKEIVSPALDQDSLNPEFPSLDGLHILVVDDDQDSREFIAFVLQQDGAKVTMASNALEALQAFDQAHPDCLVSDIGMPEMDGYTLMRQVRLWATEEGRKIAAIALTAYAGDYDRKLAIEAGYQQHLSKPVDPTELVNTIARLSKHHCQ